MDWWQLINFDKPDNEFSVVRNLYYSVSVSRITFRLNRYPQEALQIVASVWSRPPIFTTMVEAVGHKPSRFITMVDRGGVRIKTTRIRIEIAEIRINRGDLN